MASVFELDYTKIHGVAESTLMLATMSGGHFYNLVADVDVDNGSVATIGDYKTADLWKAAIPKVADKVTLILTAPKIYEEFTTKTQEDQYFYNAKGEAMRAYEIYETDRFALNAAAFAEDADPAVGKYVVVDGTGYKLTTTDTEPTTYGFVGYIYAIAANGNYRIFVKRNRPIE